MPSPTGTLISALQRHHRDTMLLRGGLLLLALLAFAWVAIKGEEAALVARVKGESKQLQLTLNDQIDVVRAHVFAMQRAVQHNLVRSDDLAVTLSPGPNKAGLSQDALIARGDKGSVHAHPSVQTGQRQFQEDLQAAANFIPIAAANHQWRNMYQWSYFYDAAESWFLIYPTLGRAELLKATGQSDMAAAMRTVFEADGTKPVALLGPRQNPQREMVWTRAYQDASGKGLMASLLAPVYKTDTYVGAVGTDLTLNTLRSALIAHAPPMSEAMLLDRDGTVLANTLAQSENRGTAKVQRLVDLYPGLELRDVAQGRSGWLRLDVAHTPWSLVVHVNDHALRTHMLHTLWPYVGMAVLLVLALFGLAYMQHRRYIDPALRLAAYLQELEHTPDQPAPTAPRTWQPLYAQVQSAAQERQRLLQQAQQQADALEVRVKARTSELSTANQELTQTLASLQRAQRHLLASDRMGSLGARVVGVTNDVSLPLGHAQATMAALLARLQQFEQFVHKGLRRSDLDAFVQAARQGCVSVDENLHNAATLVKGFKQLALDREQEVPSRFMLKELVANTLAVMSPQLTRRACTVSNDMQADMDMQSYPGVLGQVLGYVLEAVLQRMDAVAGTCSIRLSSDWGAGGGAERVVISIHDDIPVSEGGAVSVAQDSDQPLAKARDLLAERLGGTLSVYPGATGTRVQLHVRRHAT